MKRDENERSLGKPRVGDVEIGVVKHEASKEQNVEVEGTRAVLHAYGTVAAEFALDVEQGLNECRRGKAGFKSNDSVNEAGLIRKSHRLR